MTLAARLFAAVLGAALAAPAAADWTQLRRDGAAMLSVDPLSIQRNGDVASFRYLVDYRLPQGESRPSYRSTITEAKADCKARKLSVVHTDAYAFLGGKGAVIAKTKLSPQESAFKPLQKDTSDVDLWNFVCQGKAPPLSPPPKQAPPAKK
jgi:hypothetical protein